MQARLLFSIATILALAFSGCIQGESASVSPTAAPPTAQAAEFTEDTGAIEGIVTNDENLPLGGVAVGLLETGALASTAQDGRYSLSNLAPGAYTVNVAALGYETAAKLVTVTAGGVEQANFQLKPVPIEEPYYETVIRVATLGCSVTFMPGVPLGGVIAPGWYTGVQVCGVTDSRFIQQFNVSAGVEELLLEVTWESTQILGTGLSVAWEHPNGVNDGSPVFESPSGKSPLRAHANHSSVLGVAEAQEINVTEDDWQTQTRTFSAANTTEFYLPFEMPDVPPFGQPSNKVDVGFAYDQRSEHYQTNFYLMTMPEGFTALPDQ